MAKMVVTQAGIAFRRTPEEKRVSMEKRELQKEKEELMKLKEELKKELDKLKQITKNGDLNG